MMPISDIQIMLQSLTYFLLYEFENSNRQKSHQCFIISKVLHIQILIVIAKLLHKVRYTNDTSNKFSLFTL